MPAADSTPPSAALVIREHKGQPFYEAKFRYRGRQVMRRVGPAWLKRDDTGRWAPRRGRCPEGSYTERTATVRAASLVTAFIADANDAERVEAERRTRGVTFRQVAHDYLTWLKNEYGAKPSTLQDYGYLLAEPGAAHKRGSKTAQAHIMRALGDLPADKITKAQLQTLLRSLADTGVSPRTINKTRNLIGAIFNYGATEAIDYKLTANPVAGIKARREPESAPLAFYSPEEVEAAARALAAGQHRDPTREAVSDDERALRVAQDAQDAEAVRIAAYCGLRQGELLELRWQDVDWQRSVLTVRRALSADEITTTKSGKSRRVPLSDQAAAALDRLSKRSDFISPNDLVLCNHLGRKLDGSALRKRFQRATTRAGLQPLRWHDLRHTFGSLLVANGIDLVTVKAALGHSRITTTERYLHARPAHEQAAAFTRAFEGAAPESTLRVTGGRT